MSFALHLDPSQDILLSIRELERGAVRLAEAMHEEPHLGDPISDPTSEMAAQLREMVEMHEVLVSATGPRPPGTPDPVYVLGRQLM
jgi:hypothetical protein